MSFFSSLTDRVAVIRALAGEVPDAVLLPAAVDRLDDAGAVELLELAASVGQMVERVRVAAAGVVAQRSSRTAGHAGLAQSLGHRNAVSLVQQVTGVSRGEAVKQVRVGESLYDTAGMSAPAADVGVHKGETETTDEVESAGPWHAPLGAALMNGALTAAQHDAIFRGLGQPPEHDCAQLPDLRGGQPATDTGHDCVRANLENAAAWAVAAERLVAEAAWRTVEDLARAARAVRDRLDPEGAEARYLARYEARSFRMWTDREGLHRVSLVCDDVSAAWLRSVRDAALRPRRGGPRFVDPAERIRAEELAADPRSNEQLEFDLFMDLVRAGALADAGAVCGTRQAGVRLVQVVDCDSIRGVDTRGVDTRSVDAQAAGSRGASAQRAGARNAGRFEDDPAVVPAGVVAQQACASGIVPVTIDRAGRPLDVGREQRLYTSRQRIALAVRDGGCRWPGCDRPPAYCEAHHIDEWQKDQGCTDLDRGVLLCRFHHMQLHANSWRITRTGDGTSARDGTGVGFGDGDAGSGLGLGLGPDSGCFMLHDPDGRAIPMRPRLELRYAWGDLGPPRQRFRLVA
jgi:hypothetical protein